MQFLSILKIWGRFVKTVASELWSYLVGDNRGDITLMGESLFTMVDDGESWTDLICLEGLIDFASEGIEEQYMALGKAFFILIYHIDVLLSSRYN